MEPIINSISRKKMFLILLASKFIYGSRLITIFYISKKEKSLKKLILYNTLAIIVWILIIAPLIWVIGKSVFVSFDVLRDFRKTIGLAVLFAIAIYVLNRVVISKTIRHFANKKR